jgi:energy-coupling factor transporter ATP-binding protein EcfA2
VFKSTKKLGSTTEFFNVKRVFLLIMDILEILHNELRQTEPIKAITVEYVETLADASDNYLPNSGYCGDVLDKSPYWINWSEQLGAWVSFDGLDIRVCVTESARDLDPVRLTLGFTSTQGRVAIHANAVIFNNKAIAFVGYSGAGKSTLSAFCASCGAGFITDDVLVINEQGQAVPGNPRIKLYPKTGESLGLDASQETAYKIFYHPEKHLGGTYQREPVPLGGLYLLTANETDKIHSELVSPAQAVFELLTHGYDVNRFIDRNPRLLDAYVQLVNQSPVRRLFYPHDFSQLPAVYDFLLQESQK